MIHVDHYIMGIPKWNSLVSPEPVYHSQSKQSVDVFVVAL